jgi:hypothetical protein
MSTRIENQNTGGQAVANPFTAGSTPAGNVLTKYHYYVTYEGKEGKGRRFHYSSTPLNTETAIIEAHVEIEKELGFRVVILDWKRID